MRRETTISITILVVGFFAIALYWFAEEKSNYSIEEERLILPKKGEKEESHKKVLNSLSQISIK